MEITGTMATTIKAMVDTGAMITRVTTTTTDMVTTAVCNTVCERTDEKLRKYCIVDCRYSTRTMTVVH